jgi:hypothetical protein
MDEVEQRVGALKQARDALQYMDHTADDLIVVADWILTGTYEAALAFDEARARHYRERYGPDLVSPDAMTWSPPLTQD